MESSLRLASDENSKPITKKINFTMAAIEKLKCPASKDRIYVYDTHSPGLALAITANNSKRFYLIYKFNNAPRRYGLGGFPDINVDDARKLATKARARIAEGHDPQLERQAARAETTLGEVFKWYMDHHATPHKRSAAKDQERYDKHLSDWAKRKISAITLQDVQALHTKIGTKDKSPGAANRVLALLSVVYNKSRLMGYSGANPTEGISRYKETERERYLSPTELPIFLKALEDEPNQTWKDFFGLCLWTGARSGNVKSMTWAEVNLTAGVWTIPAEKFKTGKPMTVHLAEPAMVILTARQASATSDFVFPAVDGGRRVSKSGHIQEPKKAWETLCERAGITNLWIHDLRRTLGSWQAAAGASLHVIGKTLGHRNQKTTQIYARLDLSPVKASVNAATAAMLAAGKPVEPVRPVKNTKGKKKS